VDGSVSDVPDSKANDEYFGRPSNQARDGAFAQVRWVVAAESGTGSLLGGALGRYRTSEQELARDLLEQGCFGPGTIVLADRKFLSWQMARYFLATGAHILWRASASFTLKPVKALADGTYLAELKPPRKKDGPPVTVRVIEYTVRTAPAAGGKAETSEVFCLVTDLLDPEEHPALDLACCYPGRWGCETVIGRHKTDMGEGQPVLRSKDPAGVQQEMWALFAVYQALCKIIGIGADAAGIPPSRISFPHALAAATDTVAAFPP
jgi:hypothetical protein